MIGRVASIGLNHVVKPTVVKAVEQLPMPDLHGRLRAPDFNIDLSKDVIVLWVTGTSNHRVHPEFEELVRLRWSSVTVHLVDYMASWRFSLSKPNGEANLRVILDYLRKKMRKGQKLYIAGESQGAWVISDVLKEKRYYDLVDKAVLFGHPGASDKHFHEPTGKVLEINNPSDITTYPINVDKEELVEYVERVVRGDLTALPYWLGFGFKHPDAVATFAAQMIGKLPVLSSLLPDPHDYRRDMFLAVTWLAS